MNGMTGEDIKNMLLNLKKMNYHQLVAYKKAVENELEER